MAKPIPYYKVITLQLKINKLKFKKSNELMLNLKNSQEEKRARKRQKSYLKKIIAENFPKMGKETDFQIQEDQRMPIKISPKRYSSRHIIIKMSKLKTRRSFLKAVRENDLIAYERNSIRLSGDFTGETL